MKTSDSDLKVNQNIYPDAVTFSSSKKWLIGPNWSYLGPIRRIISHVTASGYRAVTTIYIWGGLEVTIGGGLTMVEAEELKNLF